MAKYFDRWARAQEYERWWWGAYTGDYGWYRDFSQEIAEAVAPFRPVSKETVILEIGPGPAGGLTYLDADRKYAVEPLEGYFGTLPEVRAIRDPRVHYIVGRGEELPYEWDFFDLIIIDNVLDHCEAPTRVLDEMDRVLRAGGIIFFRQNVYHRWGRFIRRLMEAVQLDRGHPHTFGPGHLEREFSKRSWNILSIARTGYGHSWLGDIRSGIPKRLVKAALFLTADRVTYVLLKPET
ncbi:class I SAM-dependent methyltransferase [Candidatus Latescibacterota bacterium]